MSSPVKKAKYPKLARFMQKVSEHHDIEDFVRTWVPGESELASRVLGIEPTYRYMHTLDPADEYFEYETLSKPSMWNQYMDKSSKSIGEAYYKPGDSPLIEVEPNIFEINPNTEFGKNLQKRIDLAYSRARESWINYPDNLESNPDKEGRRMWRGEEPLLGDVYFENDGTFEDVWNVHLDPHEKLFRNFKGEFTLSNALRAILSPGFEMNEPVVRGKATHRGYDKWQKQKQQTE